MHAGMSAKRQQLRWKSQTTARDAVERVKRGGSVKNDTHVRKLIKTTAEARYCPQGELKDLSIGAVVTLALSFTAAEWAAVNRDPMLLEETLDYFKIGEFPIDRWWTYWRNLHLEEPTFAKLFLLEIIYEYWKDDVADLIDGVRHISKGLRVGNLIEYESDEPVPKRRKANSNHPLPLKHPHYKASKYSSPVPTSDTKTLSAVTDKRPEPQSAKLPFAKNWKVVDVPSQSPINNQPRESSSNTSFNTANTYGVDEQRRIRETVSDTSRLDRTGISTISDLLNHDPLQLRKNGQVCRAAGQQSLVEAGACAIQPELYPDSIPSPHQPDADPVETGTALLRVIRFGKCTLQEIVLERPNDILGGIWFGGPQGYPPFVSLRISRALDNLIKTSGEELYVPSPSPDAGGTVTGGAHLIKLGGFRQMIRRDGFGPIYWNECGADAFITIEVMDENLAADFVQGAIPN